MRPKSKWVILPSVRVFDEVDADKEHALKPLEEASEVHGAWQEWDYWHDRDIEERHPDIDLAVMLEIYRESVVDECCDTISAMCNLLAALGVHDLTEPMRRCRERNARRGRITDGTSDR